MKSLMFKYYHIVREYLWKIQQFVKHHSQFFFRRGSQQKLFIQRLNTEANEESF